MKRVICYMKFSEVSTIVNSRSNFESFIFFQNSHLQLPHPLRHTIPIPPPGRMSTLLACCRHRHPQTISFLAHAYSKLSYRAGLENCKPGRSVRDPIPLPPPASPPPNANLESPRLPPCGEPLPAGLRPWELGELPEGEIGGLDEDAQVCRRLET
jgi:hypothetical protein